MHRLRKCFHFEKIVKNSTQYIEPWSDKFNNFLIECTECGLDNGSLQADYETWNQRIKTFTKGLEENFGKSFLVSAVPQMLSEQAELKSSQKESDTFNQARAGGVLCLD